MAETVATGQLAARETIRVDDPGEAIEYCYAQGWTDGLPVVPPTEPRVAAMLKAVSREPHEVLGILAPQNTPVTVEMVAANAVLAGCLPAYLPVVLAAIRAVLDDRFNIMASLPSTSGPAILLVVNGPVREQIGLNAGTDVFGPGNRANATIGRALRLCLMNLGGARPGQWNHACHGTPARYTFCIAENEAVSPWEPLHVERGFPPDTSTVTAFACEGTHLVGYLAGDGDPEKLLLAVADAMSACGTANVVGHGEFGSVVGPEHLATLAGAGWSKRDVKEFLFEHAGRTVAAMKRVGKVSGEVEPGDDEQILRVVTQPDDFIVVAASGDVGRWATIIPGFAAPVTARSVTVAVG